MPFDLSYEVDAWGRIRLTVQSATASAQASAADLETARLSYHAELAADYFALRGLDAQKQLLDSTVVAYQKALDLTTNRYNGGLAAKVEVAQAATQLQTTEAQAIDVGVQRAQFEHAIAALVGQPRIDLLDPRFAARYASPPNSGGSALRFIAAPAGHRCVRTAHGRRQRSNWNSQDSVLPHANS